MDKRTYILIIDGEATPATTLESVRRRIRRRIDAIQRERGKDRGCYEFDMQNRPSVTMWDAWGIRHEFKVVRVTDLSVINHISRN